MDKLKIGFIGSEHVHSPGILNSLLLNADKFEIVGFDDVRGKDEWRKKNLPVYENLRRIPFDDMLKDENIDAMIIETAERDNLAAAEKCAEAGKPFHMDKPAGTDPEKFEKILGEMKRKGLPVSLGYMYRSNSAVRYMLEAVRGGKIGEVHEVKCRMSVEHTDGERKHIANYPGGIMYFLVCHLIDLIYTVMGEPEEIIPAVVSHERNGIISPDDATLMMKYKNGTATARACSLEVGGWGLRECSVFGDKGTIEIKPMENPQIVREILKETERNVYSPQGWSDVPVRQFRDRYEIMLYDFAATVRGEKRQEYSYEHEAKLQRMLLYACGFDVDWKKKILL